MASASPYRPLDEPPAIRRTRPPALLAVLGGAGFVAMAVVAITTVTQGFPRPHDVVQLAGAAPHVAPALGRPLRVALSAPIPVSEPRDGSAIQVPPGQMLHWLRNRSFNLRTEQTLERHPMVLAAEGGTMPLRAVELILFEEHRIEQSDLQSMAAALARFGSMGNATRILFLSCADAENAAGVKLLAMAASVFHLSDKDLDVYQPIPAAHAYSAYIAQLANYGGAGAIAAGFAVNFPTWGRMCGRIADALQKAPYSLTAADVDFLTFFATPQPGFDKLATEVVEEAMAKGETAASIESAVQLMQGYEVMFWDTIWQHARLS